MGNIIEEKHILQRGKNRMSWGHKIRRQTSAKVRKKVEICETEEISEE